MQPGPVIVVIAIVLFGLITIGNTISYIRKIKSEKDKPKKGEK